MAAIWSLKSIALRIMLNSFLRPGLSLAFALLVGSHACTQTVPPAPGIEPGVSLDLATSRKALLSKIRYQLYLDIPAVKQEPVQASVNILFNYQQTGADLQLDFKADRDQLRTVTVNGIKVPVVLLKEHVVIRAKYLVTGANKINLRFIAGDLSINRSEDYLYSLLVPDRARTLFPCFDQPDLKASFQLSLVIPVNWTALSNAPLADSSVDGKRKTYRYAPSDQISTYLFSFAAGEFKRVTRLEGGRRMNFFHRETDSSRIGLSMDSIFRLHVDALEFLEQYTKLKYPFKKFDFIAIPDFQYGGMEHVGAIQYKASALFLDSGATKDQLNARSNLISHETSHMWFGDLVTMKWFNDVWTKEVFANFIADKITRGKQGEKNFDLKFLIDHNPAAYSVDRTAGANPIRQALSNLQEAGTLYGNIIYHKAPIMMRQLEKLTGRDALKNGLREYLSKFRYANANWPQLIQVLGKHCTANLESWNKVWVNEPGRPDIGYQLVVKAGTISELIIKQQAENGSSNVLPQFFKIAMVYPDSVAEFDVNLNKQRVELTSVKGMPVPMSILFNSGGEGYGLFPADSTLTGALAVLKDPVMRASAYINLYEQLLSGTIKPQIFMRALREGLHREPEELNLKLITGYLGDIFWRLTTEDERVSLAGDLEKELWQAMLDEPISNKKKLLFRAFQSIAISAAAKDGLYGIWQNQKAPAGVKLSEDDYTGLVCSLLLRDHPDTGIGAVEIKRIRNEDRKKRLEYLLPALSSHVSIRDSFFYSLRSAKNREKEAWVVAALEFLHHPLRSQASVHYLPQTLELLEEIQATGDIFFPGAWLQASFGFYQSTEAANIVRDFLNAHPGYNPKLKAKILQAADPLFRAEKLLSSR